MVSRRKVWIYWILVISVIVGAFLAIALSDVIIINLITIFFTVLAIILFVVLAKTLLSAISRCPFCGNAGLKMNPIKEDAGTCKHCGKTVEWEK